MNELGNRLRAGEAGMNCKPGDLAIVVRAEGTGVQGRVCELLVGRIVRVVRLRPPTDKTCYASLVWEFETPIQVVLDGHTFTADGCGDELLRPIRDPGDDAVDETLLRLPAPTLEAA